MLHSFYLVSNNSQCNVCDWRLKKKVEATAKPIVVPIPDAQGPIEQEESLSMLIKRALGVDLTKKK